MGAPFWLSLVMGVVGIVGLLIAGKGRWQGWLIGLLVQPVWVVFFIVVDAWPGVILPVAYGAVYTKNLIAWRREEQRGGTQMAITKYGRGEVLPEPGDIKKQAGMSEEEVEDLEDENAEVDK